MKLFTALFVAVPMISLTPSLPAQLQTQTIQIGPGSGPQPPPTQSGPSPRLPPRDAQQTPQTGTSVIRGRVVGVETGQPMRRVLVRATAPELREGRTAATDEQGRYDLKELPAGRYTISASKNGFITMSYGQRWALEPGRPVELAVGQILEKIDFSLPRAGVIAGRIVDEYGEPVMGATVQVMRYRFLAGRRQLTSAGGGGIFNQTNDLGEFRVFGLPPGEYYVSATMRSLGAFPGRAPDNLGYAPTFYHGALLASDAQTVTVGAGEEVPGVSFALVPSRVARISGTVLRSDGRLAASGSLMLVQTFGTGSSGRGVPLAPDGSFNIAGVSPGEYRIDFRPEPNARQEGEFASLDLTVTGDDIKGLQIVARPGATVRGQLLFDTGEPPAGARPQQFSIQTVSLTPGPIGGNPNPTLRDDWSFEMTGAIGERLLRIGNAPGSTPTGWFLKSVLFESNDITDTPLKFQGGEQVEGLQIVLTQRQTDISGTVTDARGNVAKDYTVIIFADDNEKWGPQTRFRRTVRPDQQGRFTTRGLPPERYRAVAVEFIEPGEDTNPEVLERLSAGAESFEIKEGEAKTLNLKLSSY